MQRPISDSSRVQCTNMHVQIDYASKSIRSDFSSSSSAWLAKFSEVHCTLVRCCISASECNGSDHLRDNNLNRPSAKYVSLKKSISRHLTRIQLSFITSYQTGGVFSLPRLLCAGNGAHLGLRPRTMGTISRRGHDDMVNIWFFVQTCRSGRWKARSGSIFSIFIFFYHSTSSHRPDFFVVM